jgi:hypothetical protein
VSWRHMRPETVQNRRKSHETDSSAAASHGSPANLHLCRSVLPYQASSNTTY